MATGAAQAGPSLRPNREGRLHVGMEATVIVDGAGLLQNQSDGLLRRHRHIPIAVSRGCGMDENVLVDPFDGVADLGRGPDGSDLRYLGVAHDDFALSNNMLLLMGWMRQRQIGSRHPLADLMFFRSLARNASDNRHPRLNSVAARETWMAGTSSAKTRFALL